MSQNHLQSCQSHHTHTLKSPCCDDGLWGRWLGFENEDGTIMITLPLLWFFFVCIAMAFIQIHLLFEFTGVSFLLIARCCCCIKYLSWKKKPISLAFVKLSCQLQALLQRHVFDKVAANLLFADCRALWRRKKQGLLAQITTCQVETSRNVTNLESWLSASGPEGKRRRKWEKRKQRNLTEQQPRRGWSHPETWPDSPAPPNKQCMLGPDSRRPSCCPCFISRFSFP